MFGIICFFVYCRELAPGTISLTVGQTNGDGSKQYVSGNGCKTYTVMHNLVFEHSETLSFA